MRVLLDIPNISNEEKINRYTRALKPSVWKEMYTKDYGELSEDMTNAEQIRAVHTRAGRIDLRTSISIQPSRSSVITNGSGVAPLDLGNAQV